MNIRTITIASLVVLAACSSAGEITVTDPWGRPSPAMADAAAFYMEIDNATDTDVTLIAASTNACGVVELHESSMNDDGVMMMAEQEAGIAVPAGSATTLEPGGLHVMCLQMTDPLAVGDSIDVELEFDDGTSESVVVEIRE